MRMKIMVKMSLVESNWKISFNKNMLIDFSCDWYGGKGKVAIATIQAYLLLNLHPAVFTNWLTKQVKMIHTGGNQHKCTKCSIQPSWHAREAWVDSHWRKASQMWHTQQVIWSCSKFKGVPEWIQMAMMMILTIMMTMKQDKQAVALSSCPEWMLMAAKEPVQNRNMNDHHCTMG